MTACIVADGPGTAPGDGPSAMNPSQHLDVRKQGDVTVVCMGRQRLHDDVVLKRITDELHAVLDGPNCRYLLVNLEGVVPPSSKLIGNLITLHRKMKAKGGKLGLCHVESEVERTLRVMNLHQLFAIWESESDGLLAFEEAAWTGQA